MGTSPVSCVWRICPPPPPRPTMSKYDISSLGWIMIKIMIDFVLFKFFIIDKGKCRLARFSFDGFQSPDSSVCTHVAIYPTAGKDIPRTAAGWHGRASCRRSEAAGRGRRPSCRSTCSARPGTAPPGCSEWRSSVGWPPPPPPASATSALQSFLESEVFLKQTQTPKEFIFLWTSVNNSKRQPLSRLTFNTGGSNLT